MLALEAFGTVDHRHPAGSSLVGAATSEFLDRIDRAVVSRALADAAYGQYLAAAGKRMFIDKTPRYWMVLDFLSSLYPEAPRILITRNPYAIAASLKSTWGISLASAGCPSAIASCLTDLAREVPTPAVVSCLADLVLGLPTLAALRGRPRTQVVQYEILVVHPDEEIRRVIAGLGYDPADVTSATVEQADVFSSSTFGDRKIFEKKTIDDRSVQAWRTALSTEEMQVVTDLVGTELLIELGYEQDLRYAQQVGIVDRGPVVTESYRQLFRTCWDLRGGTGGSSFGVSTHTRELNGIVRQAGGGSSVSEAQREKTEEHLRLMNSMVAQLEQVLRAAKGGHGSWLGR
uniref:NoeE n=2 Tax=Bradyrhizobium TaxID=374 RepID=I2AWH7_BRAEL|nr:NoeE [Bradyrhizobium elkanii]